MGVRVKVLVMILCGQSTSQKNGGPGDYAKKIERDGRWDTSTGHLN